MTLYEVTNGSCGESYVRVYVWCDSEEKALSMARRAFTTGGKDFKRLSAHALLSEYDAPFATNPSDSGWVRDYPEW